jgi:putative two-component system response regulator
METKKHTLLIVDDEIMVIRSLLRVLENEAYVILHVVDPMKAVEILANTPVDVVISDQRMPEMTGLELMVRAKEIQPAAVRILMSGYSDIDIVIAAINEGRIYQYITKPWDNDRLVETVENALVFKTEEDEKSEILAVNLDKIESWNTILNQLNGELQKKNDRTVNALVKVLKAKDPNLYKHCACVSETAAALADILGLTSEQQDAVRYAGLLHDIGKIAIRDKIMYKAGALDDDEYNEMKHHPTVGADILREVEFFDSIADIVEQHHERLDGLGYPKGLRRNELLLESQIITVADTYEALIEDRVYRRRMNPAVALQILHEGKNGKFNADIVDALEAFINSISREYEMASQSTSESIGAGN